jgi:hypothetical protein
MPIPADYYYKTDPVAGPGYWKSDGTGPYSFNGTAMTLMNKSGISQVGLSTLQATQGTFWDQDDSSGPVTVRS